jgi:hypothetical protein
MVIPFDVGPFRFANRFYVFAGEVVGRKRSVNGFEAETQIVKPLD